MATDPVAHLTVSMSITFRVLPNNGGQFGIGVRSDTVVYVKNARGKFERDREQSSSLAQDEEEFYSDLDFDFTPDQFLKFNLSGLQHLVASIEPKERT